ncbi:MAG: ATP synthase F1 subunit gamma [Bacteroidales bacterium]|jgi:F-type H+-transporting ATPase subunit gamma|nr:ATP synthase F1 subunit gamma [Bacteroidales bacterium]
MANLKEVRTRINSVNSTMQITAAMKMVSASKLRKSQSAIVTLRPYSSKLQGIMQNLSASMQTSSEGVYAKVHKENPEDEKILLIPVASNKGLCGVFNVTVLRELLDVLQNEYKVQYENGNVDILCISKKIEETLLFKKYRLAGNRNDLLDSLTYDRAVEFAEQLMSDFASEKYDRIIFIYNQFKNASTQILTKEQFLPIVSGMTAEEEKNPANEVEYIFQPSKEEILNTMIPKSLKLQVYKILLDSFTSEHGARMVSMTQATDNAAELLKELNLSYNKARQSAITNEIIEIVSGANAL